MIEQIRNELFNLQDNDYRAFQIKLIPTVKSETVIGVRTPALRKYAGQLSKSNEVISFLDSIPHYYFDENQLHAFIISEIKDFPKCIKRVESFLPYVDNWATCDQLSPKVFKKHKQELLKHIEAWLKSEKTYTVRFGIGTLMQHYLDENFDPAYLKTVAEIESEEYYVNMMKAWYFATALAKQYEHTIPYILEKRLDKWTHNKTIQKAVESYRITPKQKTILKNLKIK